MFSDVIGITVLLTILGAHTQTGWSQFTDQSTAQNFVNYLNSQVVRLYGLDGIDIDDEFSSGPVNNSSLAMVTTLMKQSMPGKLITKALWGDHDRFTANWNGNTLGANLDYGWEMSYYSAGDANSRLGFYTSYMKKSQLCLGFSAERRYHSKWSQYGPQAATTISEGYAGGMMFAYENQPDSIDLMKAMVDGMDGPGSWNTVATENSNKDRATSFSPRFEVEDEGGKISNRRCCIIV